MKHYTCLLLASLLLTAASCSKKSSDDQQSISSCKLLSMYFDSDSIRVYRYDASGKLVLKWTSLSKGLTSIPLIMYTRTISIHTCTARPAIPHFIHMTHKAG